MNTSTRVRARKIGGKGEVLASTGFGPDSLAVASAAIVQELHAMDSSDVYIVETADCRRISESEMTLRDGHLIEVECVADGHDYRGYESFGVLTDECQTCGHRRVSWPA